MFDNVKVTFKRWSEEGMRWPFLRDPVNNRPSVTLLFFYITFILASIATIVSTTFMVLDGEYLKSTLMPIMMFVLGFVFYRLRSLDHVKIDLNNQDIELSSGDDIPKREKDDQPN